MSDSIAVDGATVRLSHPGKVLFPGTGPRKIDLAEYCRRIAPRGGRHAGGGAVAQKATVCRPQALVVRPAASMRAAADCSSYSGGMGCPGS